MTEISQIIYQFRTFIIRCWPSIIELDEAENDCTMSFEENCIEVLWELIMETLLFTKLQTKVIIKCYHAGEGIELYLNSNRAFFTDHEVTHEIFCLPKTGQYVFDFIDKTNIFLTADDHFEFDCFVTLSADQSMPYLEEPPFDYLLCIVNQTTRVFKIEDCNFYIRKVSDEV
jgi:hypothetical protein